MLQVLLRQIRLIFEAGLGREMKIQREMDCKE